MVEYSGWSGEDQSILTGNHAYLPTRSTRTYFNFHSVSVRAPNFAREQVAGKTACRVPRWRQVGDKATRV